MVVCNGHYTEPNLPAVPGMSSFPGLVMHSHNYRDPEAFRGETVLVIGASNSGEDIMRELSPVADRVYISARSWKVASGTAPLDASLTSSDTPSFDSTPFGPRGNIERRGMVARFGPQGSAEFEQGPPVSHIDTVIFATGYRYSFPFLDGSSIVQTEDQHVYPLYQHMFPPQYSPSLAFVGLPWKVVPFPLFEYQAKYIARLLAGQLTLPSVADMKAHIAAFNKHLDQEGTPVRYAHMMPNNTQWEYNEWLAAACGDDVSPLPSWRPAMYASTGLNKRLHPDDYRDRWDDADSAAQAEAEFAELRQSVHHVQEQPSVVNC